MDIDRGCAPNPAVFGWWGRGVRLQFDKGGRRFFFLTFCVRGRSAVLSRIVEKVGRDGKRAYGVELTAAGEAMAALWRGVHARWPFLTASNYIIMPDHLHLLLIVDYSKAQGFDILDWFQRFRREGEDVVSPIIGVKPEFVWEDHFWILLLNAGKPLAAVRRYIKMNPARKIWKDGHPDLFVRRGGLHHPVLDASLSWTAIGDLTLLANPFMFPVRLTRKMTVEQHEPEIAQLVERACRGEVPVCGFLSPGEKELERRLRQEPHVRWIKTVAHGLPPRFDPTVEDSRFLAEGRQLLLSSFPVDVPVFPVNYDNCHLMNARNEELCKRAAVGVGAQSSLARPTMRMAGLGVVPPLAQAATCVAGFEVVPPLAQAATCVAGFGVQPRSMSKWRKGNDQDCSRRYNDAGG